MFVICKDFEPLTIEELLIVFIMFKLGTHKQLQYYCSKSTLFAHKKEHSLYIYTVSVYKYTMEKQNLYLL